MGSAIRESATALLILFFRCFVAFFFPAVSRSILADFLPPPRSFVVASVLRTRHQTPVAKRNVNPTYQAKDATFDFPLYLSLADRLGVVELIVWDKDVLTKEYLGEAALPLEDWFVDRETARERPFAFEDAGNVVRGSCFCFGFWGVGLDTRTRCVPFFPF